MLTKRLFAYRLNVDLCLLRVWKGGEWQISSKFSNVYFWTFTRKEFTSPQDFGKAWNKLLTYLKRYIPGFSGIRVFELHPGKWGEFSHGLHCHFVASKFFHIRRVLEMVQAAGWGRTNVKILPSDSRHYGGKYLAKKRPPALRGIRLTSCVGMPGFTRLKEIGVDSNRSRAFRQAARMTHKKPWDEMGWMEKLHAVSCIQWLALTTDLVWNESRVRYCAPDRASHADIMQARRGVDVPLIQNDFADCDPYTASVLRSGGKFSTILTA